MDYGTRVTTKYPVWIAMPCIGVTLLSGANCDNWNSQSVGHTYQQKNLRQKIITKKNDSSI